MTAYVIPPNAHNTTKMMKNSLYYGRYTNVGYNPTTGEIIVSDNVSGLERGKYWNIQKVSPYPVAIYLFELAEGDENLEGERMHLYTVPTNFLGLTPEFNSEKFQPRQDIIQSWKDRGAKLLAHTVYFYQLPKSLEWATPESDQWEEWE